MGRVYAYAKISKKAQKIERQIENLKKAYPTARLYQEAYTGTKIEGRKEFNKLKSIDDNSCCLEREVVYILHCWCLFMFRV